MLEMPVEQFEWLSEKLDKIQEDTASLRIEAATNREKITNINEHLARINGRVGIGEKKVVELSEIVTELRGAWKLLAALASAIGAGIAWLVQHLSVGQHK